VLHAANGVQNALAQCRTLLRPNGRILLLETTNREYLIERYISKLLPKFSQKASPEYVKNKSPLLTESEWGDMLLQTGFGGIETCISDAGYFTENSVSAIIISRALSPPVASKMKIHVFYDESCTTQGQILRDMTTGPAATEDIYVMPVPWHTVEEHDLTQTICVFLVDSNGSFLAQLQDDDLRRLKGVFSAAKAFFWVTSQCSNGDRSPMTGLVPGLIRTLATESEDCLVASINLDATVVAETAAANITKVVTAFSQTLGVPEDEYIERYGQLCIPRVVRDDAISDGVYASDRRVNQPWNQLEYPRLTIGTVGRLNTLHFEKAVPLSTMDDRDEVAVEIKAVGLTPWDLAVAQGKIYEEAFGTQFAGVVSQASSLSEFKVGDRVCGMGTDAMSYSIRCKTSQLQRLPPNMDFYEGATHVVTFCIAYYGLIYCARLRRGESVLVHCATGELGQAMIRLAQFYDCDIYITTESVEQTAYIVNTYRIPKSHIFSTHESGFSSGVDHFTKGRGVDVVVSSAVGEAVRASWDCLATLGRYVDAGYKAATTPLPMGKGRIFFGLDIQEALQTAHFRTIFDEAVQMIEDKNIFPPKEICVFKQSEIFEAFRALQSEIRIGGVVINMKSDEVVEMVLAENKKPIFSSNCSYLLAGGFGGIGQGIARWMVQNGAKNLILPSRSRIDGTGSEREQFVQELRSQGADVRAPLCDIADSAAVQACLQDLTEMPPIKGCIQAAMVLRDSSFEKISTEDWHASLSPKLAGSWNLHQLLPDDLDFFVMFSSSTGIMGSFGQSNYTAGNTYQDALAAHRIKHGQRAHAIAMSMVVGVGWVAENAQVQALLRVRGMLEEVTLDDIYELLRYCCNPENTEVGGQIITSLSLPADLDALGIVAPLGSTRPIYSHLQTLPSRYGTSAGGADQPEAKKLPSVALQNASSLAEATDIITEAIQTQLSSLLVVSKDDIDSKKPIHMYGVDSLVAVEMKNWFSKGVGVEVSVTEILGGVGMAELAAKVVTSSRFVKEELKL
jgi:NADPH:quinone reductase-like Zn-dependent oxidoreductase/NAD(P)-dependent dehydrogenase (short-subunit alcohol dehydrogenase family)